MNLLDLIFPKICLSCNKIIKNDSFICESCFNNIVFIENTCRNCGKPISKNINLCKNCNNLEVFVWIHSIAVFDGIIKKLIHNFKYKKNIHIADFFADLFCKYLNNKNISLKEINYILPVPISKNRLKLRGFNQTELLAHQIQKHIKIPVLSDSLMKTNSLPQTNLSAEERKINLKNTFFCTDNSKFEKKNILILDDVITTGSTILEIGKTLKMAGAEKIFAFSIAHGI